ncbi:ctenidin-1-like [Haliotis rubra]|uniref:ctenidin-1-like n=1 Tax=Haliotis rubra TaxID=36100 RepID=UPI001EE5601D|nr:ctenidin-1-like [Haliotis rubra]
MDADKCQKACLGAISLDYPSPLDILASTQPPHYLTCLPKMMKLIVVLVACLAVATYAKPMGYGMGMYGGVGGLGYGMGGLYGGMGGFGLGGLYGGMGLFGGFGGLYGGMGGLHGGMGGLYGGMYGGMGLGKGIGMGYGYY